MSGVAFRDAVLQSFNQILDRSMRTVSVVNVLFACVIAFGVVYNGARIALSERGNELASLRVLGFTRREVTWLLLGEQGRAHAAGRAARIRAWHLDRLAARPGA